MLLKHKHRNSSISSKKFVKATSPEGRPERGKSPAVMLSEFDPLPGPLVQKKVDYFYLPYSPMLSRSKFMQFETDEFKFIQG